MTDMYNSLPHLVHSILVHPSLAPIHFACVPLPQIHLDLLSFNYLNFG
jgi:hypothetical protein